jgi:2-C-methyl-D-erythritol 2,4-cyclodiphosphate synthase
MSSSCHHGRSVWRGRAPTSTFSPSDARWKGADSAVFLAEAMSRVKSAGYRVANLDSTLILAAPKIGPHTAAIRKHISSLMNLSPDCIGIKAKTPEGLDLDNAAMAHVVVLLEEIPKSPKPRKSKQSTQ